MSLDLQFPDAKFGFRSPSGFIKGKVEHACCGCGQPAHWFHNAVMLYFCSEECQEGFIKRPHNSPSSMPPSRRSDDKADGRSALLYMLAACSVVAAYSWWLS